MSTVGTVLAAVRPGDGDSHDASGTERADAAAGNAGPPTTERVVGSLSPSRAADFLACPMLYRFRAVDRIPERPSLAAARGTVVHAVLERLFDLPPSERTRERAAGLVEPEWTRLLREDPELSELFATPASVPGEPACVGEAEPETKAGAEPRPDIADWLAGARELLERYFMLEDPRRLEPARREHYVETVLDTGLVLRGYVDRLDVAPDGAMRVVDYKTGRAPRETYEAKALFQMRFYALVLWKLHGRVPRMLQLLYLGSGEVLRYEPDEADLRATERKLLALWEAIRRAVDTGDWRPRPSRLCDWCEHRESLCPAWGGTPPPLPAPAALPGTLAAPAAWADNDGSRSAALGRTPGPALLGLDSAVDERPSPRSGAVDI